MTARVIAGISLLFMTGSALAAEPPKPNDPAQACIDVQIGNDRTAFLECLNSSFERHVRQEHQTPQPEAPIGVKSSPTQLGIFNETAARQRMGNAFGVTAVPQRPPKPVFSTPLLPPNTQ